MFSLLINFFIKTRCFHENFVMCESKITKFREMSFYQTASVEIMEF